MISADLGKQLESYVQQLVDTGRYGSKSEVLREGVRLVQDRRPGSPRWMLPSCAVLPMRTLIELRQRAMFSTASTPSIGRWLRRPKNRYDP